MSKATIVILSFILLFLNTNAQNDSIAKARVDTSKPDSLARIPQPVVKTSQSTTTTKVYHFNPAVDIPVIAVGSGWSLYALTKIYQKGASTEQQIMNLKTTDIPPIDRSAVRPYSHSLDSAS